LAVANPCHALHASAQPHDSTSFLACDSFFTILKHTLALRIPAICGEREAGRVALTRVNSTDIIRDATTAFTTCTRWTIRTRGQTKILWDASTLGAAYIRGRRAFTQRDPLRGHAPFIPDLAWQCANSADTRQRRFTRDITITRRKPWKLSRTLLLCTPSKEECQEHSHHPQPTTATNPYHTHTCSMSSTTITAGPC